MVYKLHKLRSRLNTITKTIVHDSEMLMENVLGQDDFINSLQKIHAGSKYLLERINDIPDSSNALLLSSMAHELRTPLCFIGYSEMLLEDAEESGQDNLIPDLQKIHTAGKHMLGMINDVLDLSKLETGKMDLRIEGFNIDIVLDEIISTVQPMVETKANTLEIKRPQILGDMQTDITKLRQILFHLLSNAAKFTERGTIYFNITLQTRTDGEWMVFDVIDNGIGMTDEQQLFLPFMTQADTSITLCENGTNLGIGLTITQKFAEMMGGTIEVNSEFGLGSTFTVSLPCSIYYK